MKKRTHQMLNFFAFNLLFFALYLNFIHKDNDSAESFPEKHSSVFAASMVKKAEAENQKIISEHPEAGVRKAP